ncbi:methyltransferase [Chloroflexota bacterium]
MTGVMRTAHGIRHVAKRLRKRPPDDFYPTEQALCDQVVERLTNFPPNGKVLDPGCGAGPWGQSVKRCYPDAKLIGIEWTAERIMRAKQGGWLDDYDYVLWSDFCRTKFPDDMKFGLIIGNPPFKHAERFVMQSLPLLAPGGMLLFLFPLTFSATIGRYERMFSREQWRPSTIYTLVERPSFTGNNKTDAIDYGLFMWHYDFTQRTINPLTNHGWFSWKIRQQRLFPAD